MDVGGFTRPVTMDRVLLRDMQRQSAEEFPMGNRQRDRALNSYFKLLRQGGLESFHFDHEDRSRSVFENFMGRMLRENGVVFIPEPFIVRTYNPENGKMIGYTPDFVTDLRMNGRRVVIEPHSVVYMTKWNVQKFELFKRVHENEYYFILVIDKPIEKLNELLAAQKTTSGLLAHEIWSLVETPRKISKSERLRNESRRKPPLESISYITGEQRETISRRIADLKVRTTSIIGVA